MAIIPADEKVFMVDKRTNTTYGGSQALQDMQQWYTMQDVADSVQPYKVFTALLTQSGGDTQQEKVSGDTLDLGVTYLISVNSEDADLTIFGAPNNNEGTYFICTNAGILDPFKPLSLLYDTGAPVATVLENTIGDIWFTYEDVGVYVGNIIGGFVAGKTSVSNSLVSYSAPLIINSFSTYDGSVVAINSNDLTYNAVELEGTVLIEIRVYN